MQLHGDIIFIALKRIQITLPNLFNASSLFSIQCRVKNCENLLIIYNTNKPNCRALFTLTSKNMNDYTVQIIALFLHTDR